MEDRPARHRGIDPVARRRRAISADHRAEIAFQFGDDIVERDFASHGPRIEIFAHPHIGDADQPRRAAAAMQPGPFGLERRPAEKAALQQAGKIMLAASSHEILPKSKQTIQ